MNGDDSTPEPTERPERTTSIQLARPGDRLPGTPYRLIEKLGGGGMGQVFRAEHVELGREVAVKLLAPTLAHDPKAMERLRREARAAARLGNPHIIDVYDLGITEDGRPYVVMKLVPGRDLKALADAEAPLDPARVVRLVRQIGDALRAAHAAGVVHRDLKPENVLVEPRADGESVTILDFGIAQSIQDTDTRLTRDGQMIGTPGYMAPEQALARPLDGRADQYALAVMTYELLSGRSPFDRLSPLQLIAAQLTEAPAPLGDVIDPARVPPAMVDVVMRGLSKEPDARFPEIADFVDALTAAADAPLAAPAPPPSKAPSRSPLPLIMLVALVGAAVGVLVVVGTGGDDPAGPDAGAPVVAVGETAPPPPLPADAGPDAAPAPTDAAVAADPDAAPAPRIAAKPPAPKPAPVKRPPKPKPRPIRRPPAPDPEPEAPDPPEPDDDPEPEAPDAPEPDDDPEPEAPEPGAVAGVTPKPAPDPPPPPPPAAPPVLRFGGLDVVGGASTRTIRRTVSGGFDDIEDCVEGKSGLTAGRRATVRFVIDADGFFGGFGGDGDPALVECGTRVLRRINRLTRRPDTGDIRVSLPLRLEAP